MNMWKMHIHQSNPLSVFGDFINGKRFVCDSNPLLSFNKRPMASPPEKKIIVAKSKDVTVMYTYPCNRLWKPKMS
jgi:hypothetical protein